MSSTTMTIDQLCLSPWNVRTNQTDANATRALEASILARGLILPLVVHPMRGQKNRWGVFAGGRRYRSIKALVGRQDLAADWPIDVIVRDLPEAELIEVSAAENLLRRDLRKYELFAAVAKANRKGDTPEKIAETLGQEISWVRQSLRLGNLAKPIFEALEGERISVEQAQAYAATEDHALQLAAFEEIEAREPQWREAAQIRAVLKVGDREIGRLLHFVGADTYRQEGGAFELDLFADSVEARGRVVDEPLLRQLADAKLQGFRDDIRRRAGRDIRFLVQAPRNDFGIDYSLQVTPRDGDDHAIVLPDGDIVAVIAIQETGKPDVTWWWATRKAKYGSAPKTTKARAAPAAVGAALGQVAGYAERQATDAAIKQEDGLTADSVEIFRALRRTILRGALVNNADAGGDIARDYLVWAQLRTELKQDSRYQVGLRGLVAEARGPESARDHIAATEAARHWSLALQELMRQTFYTGEDLADAFLDYRASPDRLKRIAAAVVTGLALERSLNHDGYLLPVHDVVAEHLGLTDDSAIRALWRPTDALLALLPKPQRLAIAEPYIESATFGAWSRMKDSDLTQAVRETVTGTAPALRASRREEAASWVHPLLRFAPVRPDGDLQEAAE